MKLLRRALLQAATVIPLAYAIQAFAPRWEDGFWRTWLLMMLLSLADLGLSIATAIERHEEREGAPTT